MDIEELSKSQIVLLTLLVSFVTSIATGIVTVSLMQQAPPAIAQTVNRVIERTVERAPSSPSRGQAAAAAAQETTVIVKESDLIADAAARAAPSVVKVYGGEGAAPDFLAFGVVVAPGDIATDAGSLGTGGEHIVQLPDGSRVRASVASRNASTGIARLAAATSTLEDAAPKWSPIGISKESPALGETVIALGGGGGIRVGQGIVEIVEESSAGSLIETDIARASIAPGSPLLDTGGNLVGIATSPSLAVSPSAFLSVAALSR